MKIRKGCASWDVSDTWRYLCLLPFRADPESRYDSVWLKIGLNHLFEHPKWSRNNFEKLVFVHFWTHR